MRVTSNHLAHLPQRTSGPQTSSSPAASSREARPSRSVLKDGFESTASSRSTTSAAPSPQADVQSLFQEQFGTLAADKQQFHDTMRNIFGQGYDHARAEQYRQQALSGNFDWMPKVEWVDASVLQGGHGAYDAESGAVLLNRELQGDPELAATTYVEEAGHHLDAQLNTVDSQGDEGELFRRVLGGEKLSQAQVAEIRAENDKGTIQLHGRDVEVEFRRNFFQRLGNAIKNTVEDVGDAIGDAVDAVGDAIGNAAEAVGEGIGNAAQWVGGVGQKVINAVASVASEFGLGPQPDRKFDGMFLGAWPQTFPPGTPLDQIPAVTPNTSTFPQGPSGNTDAGKTVLYVNGIGTSLGSQAVEMQQIADQTGMRVIGIHNSTEGMVADVVEAAGIKLPFVNDLISFVTGKGAKGSNPAVDTLADAMYTELKAGRDVHVMGYSQGALITARALKDLANRLRIEDGLPQDQVEQMMSRINVETFGGAGAIFPDGPNYVHYVNTRDIVPMAFGQGNPLDPFRDAGRGAVVHTFTEAKPFQFVQAHDLDETYLRQRVPFEDARNNDFFR
ncbi:MAG TPA: PE-PPE domain-containing protein [Myxococcaceae bacterium]|jgi:hypothetical protein